MDDNEDKRKMLFSACESGDKLALIKLIKSEKFNPSSYDMITDQGKTLLHIACRYGHIDIVRMLVEVYGCSLNAVDSTGSIPFHDACFYDQVVVADYLLHATKEPNKCLYAVDLYGNTAFHKANQSGSSHVVQYILYIIFCGKTPPKLGLDMGYEFQDCVHRNMLYLSVQNKVGDTPPAVACRHGHLAIIKLYMYYYDHIPKFSASECVPYLFYTASKCGQFEVAGYIKSIFIQKSSISQPMSQIIPRESFRLQHFDVHDYYDYDYYDDQPYKRHRSIVMLLGQDYKRWNTINNFEVTTVSEVPVYVSLLQGNNQYAVDFKDGQFCSSDEFNMCHAACIANDMDLLTTYFNKGTIKKGNSPLHTACEWGSNVVIDFLITKMNCDLNARNHAGETPLHIACRHGRVEITELLLKHSTNIINVVNQSNETPLHLACLHHDPSLANVILDKQPSDIDIPDIFGDTQLSNACRVGNFSLVKLLVEKGCNPFHINEKSMEMPVHIACKIERLDILEVLMKNCVTTTDARNRFGETPLCIAFSKLCLDIIHFMLQKQLCDVSLSLKVMDESSFKHDFGKPTGDNALHLACKMRDINLVELLLNHCSVDIKNNDGNTPFHIAAKNGSYSVMDCLISSGDYPLDDYRNNDGNSALHLACSSGSLKVVQLLIDKCCVTSKNSIGNTPIHVACGNNSFQLVSCLLTKCSRNLDCHRNDKNDTFLHVAAKAGDLDTIKILLKYCSTTCQNLNGDTPIHIACRANVQAVVECLLQGTESTCPFVNKQGETYLHAACNVNARLDVIETIIKNGYKVLGNYPNNIGDTPLHYACRSRHKEIMEYLIVNNCCDPYRFNDDNLSPIYTALEMDGNRFKFLKYILSKKLCDPNQPLKKGFPLLHCLFQLGDLDNKTQYKQEFDHLLHYDEVEYARPSHLYRRSDSRLVEMLMFLIKDCKEIIDFNATDCEGNTILHLACRSNRYEIIDVLLSTESNIVLQSISHKNHNCKTPIQLTGDYQIIRLLISYGANPEDVYNRFARILDRSKQEQPLEPAVKVIVLGNSTAGKTTLVEALKYCKDIMYVKGSTAGIETSEHTSKEFGRVTFHDFAGQPEYESSHSAFLEKCSSSVQPPIFILVVNASQQQYIEKRIHNWLSFIKNHCTDTETPPHVIVIGSHSDKLPDTEKSHTHDTYKRAIENFQSSDFECFKPVLLDCRRGRSRGMKRLQQRLKSSCFSLKKFVELDCRCHILFANLAKWFPNKTVVKVKDLQERIRHEKSNYDRRPLPRHPSAQPIVQYSAGTARYYGHNFLFDFPSSEVLLPISTDPLLSLLKSLHNGGHILLLEGEEDSWIVMNQDALFKTVNGRLFAPEEFKQHVKLDNNTGVVPLLKLQDLFPQLDFNLIRQFLVHYEFCQQIEDAETLQLIHGSKLPTENDESAANIYYFFPGYVKSEKPATLWDTPDDLPYAYSCGWMLQCQPKQFFETRFLHVLLLRLTFTFVASSSESSMLERKCDIWKNGIHWGTREGVEVLVEIIEEKTIALVLVRCFEGQELEAVKLRTAVLKKVWEAKIEFCPKIDTNEYLIHPSELTSASRSSQTFDTHRISMTEIAQTIVEGSLFVICPSSNKPLALNKLLYFEPYSRMDKQHVALFFSKDNSDDPIPPDTLLSLSSFLHAVYHHLVKVLKIPASELGYHAEKWRDHPVQMLHHLFESWTSRRKQPTFQTLRSEFNEYSIFFGRNPLVSVSYLRIYVLRLCHIYLIRSRPD